MHRSPRASGVHAFLNIPYDRANEPMLVTWIAGLCGFGFQPRATLELTGSHRRLDRIRRLLSVCRYSFHDLSGGGVVRGAPVTPRFNMPFELGLAAGLAWSGTRPHEWFVFEAVPHRLAKS